MTSLPHPGDIVNDYKIVKILDTTANSTVYEALSIHSAERVAIKMILVDESNRERVDNEISLMKEIKSQHVLGLRDVFDFGNYKCVSMPLATADLNLISKKKSSHKFCEHAVKEIIKSALEALRDLHSQGISHRDIKPDNFLLLEDGPSFLLADLGFAKKFNENELSTEYIGTLAYAAPEIINGTPCMFSSTHNCVWY